VTPGDGTTKVRPQTPIVVRAAGGTLTSVQVIDGDGGAVQGAMSDDGASWTSSSALALKRRYTVRAVATNDQGRLTSLTSRLDTVRPKDSADFYLLPSDGGRVGVGMPVVVQFAGLVDEDKRDDIEKRVSVSTSPKVAGSWGWLDARQLVWRPAKYWTPGTTVRVKADLAGVETRPGIWTMRNASASFRIGSAMISTVDIKAHTLTVRRNGEVLRTIPITTGKKGFETRRGTKVILSRETTRQMDAETTGLAKSDPEYYNIKVKYAMRLTWSGEFLHAAPWSVGSQGRANVSHGCTGMSTAHARWLFQNSKLGDVVTYVGSRRPLESYNGYTMWNMSLAEWATHSALV
jgi:lipoprotein-anchoring transpeptidase ErfK/SrfK